MKSSRLMTTALVLGASMAAAPAFATLPIQKAAKEKGFAATNCQFCHVDKLPKKGAAASNARGKFLVDQKTKKNAKEIDVSWLKDYVEKK
jgi:cytochrome c553